jgi:hypothetical protein
LPDTSEQGARMPCRRVVAAGDSERVSSRNMTPLATRFRPTLFRCTTSANRTSKPRSRTSPSLPWPMKRPATRSKLHTPARRRCRVGTRPS